MFIPHLDEARRQQSSERTVLHDGTVIPEIAWLAPNRVNASTEDLMLKAVKAAKKGLDAQFKPEPGGMTIVVSDEGVGRVFPVESLVDAYLAASGKTEDRQKAVGKFVRMQIGYPE